MKASDLIEGLQIIESCRPAKESGYHMRAEHDKIWAGLLDWEISEDKKSRLEELGWYADDEYDGWRAFV